MFKNYVLKKMMESQLRDVPPEQKEMILNVISENPELFQKIVAEVQASVKEGKDQMAAMMEVMQKHQTELQKAIGK